MEHPITQQQWLEHQEEDRINFSARPTKDEMRAIVDQALLEFFTSKGILGKNIVVTTATIVGSLLIIAGALKWLLALFGFGMISK